MKDFVLSGPQLLNLLTGPDAQMKYLRLFSVPDNPRAVDTTIEFLAKVSNWTERELGELHPDDFGDLFKRAIAKVEEAAVNPTPEPSSETGDSKPKTKSQDGA